MSELNLPYLDTINDWVTFKHNLLQYILENSIEDTDMKWSLLISMISDGIYEQLSSLILPKKMNRVSFEDLMLYLNTYFNHNICICREKFLKSKQEENESVQQWADRLEMLASMCHYKDTSEIIKDIFIMGLKSNFISVQLIAERYDVEFKDAVQIALGTEKNCYNENSCEYSRSTDSDEKNEFPVNLPGHCENSYFKEMNDYLTSSGRSSVNFPCHLSRVIGKDNDNCLNFVEDKYDEVMKYEFPLTFQDYICNLRRNRGHTIKHCPQKMVYSNDLSVLLGAFNNGSVCNLCGNSGHVNDECTKLRSGYDVRMFKNFVCHLCGTTGHTKYNCPEVTKYVMIKSMLSNNAFDCDTDILKYLSENMWGPGQYAATMYYYGYLDKILPVSEIKNQSELAERIKDYINRENKKIDLSKLLVLIPKSGRTESEIGKHSDLVESNKNLPSLELVRSGVKQRQYTNSVYTLSLDKEKTRYACVVTEYASALTTITEICKVSPEYKQLRGLMVESFYRNLQELLKEHPESQQFCELIYYDDEKMDAVSALQERIKKLLCVRESSVSEDGHEDVDSSKGDCELKSDASNYTLTLRKTK